MTIIPAAYSYCYNQANHASQSLTTLTFAATIPSHDPHFRRHHSKSSVKSLVGMLQTLRYVWYASCHHTPRSSRTLACGFACTGASQHKAAARHATRVTRDAQRHACRETKDTRVASRVTRVFELSERRVSLSERGRPYRVSRRCRRRGPILKSARSRLISTSLCLPGGASLRRLCHSLHMNEKQHPFPIVRFTSHSASLKTGRASRVTQRVRFGTRILTARGH